ncbi:hydroxymethylbilane synthase [Synechococcus sp. PCC 7336]|uniref:hydroxymethylbilane synthase n=1 Tax=Synechococcus sp. PCC 7336 TaxID=195250 RepID=UPI0003487F10|nr:hydroxymethylbilane synthase [Synechococcus sp. PCC 7336]
MARTFKIGSRKSELALVQSRWVQSELQKLHPDCSFELVTMETQGDIILDVALAKIGDKGLFTKELEVGMLQHQTDFAVHSLKDLPTHLPEGLMLGGITARENPADALVLHAKHAGASIDALPEGSVVGTSSLRRLAQLRHHYPQLSFKDIRGNLNTRLRKLDEGQYDAIILAVAGLERLGMGDRISQKLPAEVSLHAVGQGALGIECRAGDEEVLAVLQSLVDADSTRRCLAERAFLRQLEGGCQVPIGVNSEVIADAAGDRLQLTGMVASLDGQQLIRDRAIGSAEDPEAVGIQLAHLLREQGATEILQAIFATLDREAVH